MDIKGRAWKKLTNWYESRPDSPVGTVYFVDTSVPHVWAGSANGVHGLWVVLALLLGGGKAAEIQAQKTGEDYLGQHDDWIDHYVEVVHPLLAADGYIHRGHLRIEESYIHFMRSLKDCPRGEIAISEEEANRWHVDAFKEWLEQTTLLES